MLHKVCVLIFLTSASPLPNAFANKNTDNLSSQRHLLWAQEVLRYLRNLNCSQLFLNRDHCKELKTRKTYQLNFYNVENRFGTKLTATFPDGSLRHSGEHDVIVAVDYFPENPYQKLVLTVFIDNMRRPDCFFLGGHYVEHQHKCLRLAEKEGCSAKALRKHKRSRHFGKVVRRCDMDFFPSVFASGRDLENASTENKQLLQCQNLAAFAPCPVLELINSSKSTCENCLEENGDADPVRLSSRCRLFEVCDQAVILQGGWNHLLSRESDFHLLQQARTFFTRHQFAPSNVAIFYAEGGRNRPRTDAAVRAAYQKLLIRDYLKWLCRQAHCVDSLLLLVRGHTTADGSLLLWDKNNDGLASNDEIYTVEELASDLSGCSAENVYLLAEVSNGEPLLHLLRSRIREHKRLQAYVGDGNKPLIRSLIGMDHRRSCFSRLFKIGKGVEYVRGNETAADKTLLGAPCDVVPPYSEQELRRKFYGCQNVPTSQWFRRRNT